MTEMLARLSPFFWIVLKAEILGILIWDTYNFILRWILSELHTQVDGTRSWIGRACTVFFLILFLSEMEGIGYIVVYSLGIICDIDRVRIRVKKKRDFKHYMELKKLKSEAEEQATLRK